MSIASAFAGRIAWNIDKFIVLVGHWAEPILDELTELLEQEFSLSYFEFVHDKSKKDIAEDVLKSREVGQN